MPTQRGRFDGNNNRSYDPNYKKKFRHYINSPFTLDYEGVKVEVNDKGVVIITQEQKDNTYDEIVTSAALINKVSQMIFATRKVIWKDEPYHGPFGEEEQE